MFRYVVLGGLVILLGACDAPSSVRLHEPGEYHGVADPLLERSGSDAFQEQLAQRFTQVQTDR